MYKWFRLMTTVLFILSLSACSSLNSAPDGESSSTGVTTPVEKVADSNNTAKAIATDHELGALLSTLDEQTVGVACGVCIYKMEGEGCPIAAKVDGIGYYVTFNTKEEFDTHGKGLCDAASVAKVSGEVREKGIVLSSIELLDD